MMDKLVPIRSMVGATRRPRRVPVHDRPQSPAAAAGRLARVGLGRVASCKGPTIAGRAAVRRPVAARCSTRPGQLRQARLPGRGLRAVSSRTATARTTWCSRRHRSNGSATASGLVQAFDSFSPRADASGMMDGMDAFQQQAFGVLTSSKLAEALDLERRPAGVRERYGNGTRTASGRRRPRLMQQFLMARRLVEAGVRCVTLSFSCWDCHGSNFDARARQNLPHARSRRPPWSTTCTSAGWTKT